MKTRMMMIVAMVGVIAMANSAMAVQKNTANALNLNFFDPASWSSVGVPVAGDDVRLGESGPNPGVGSMIYDPANQSPANEALYQATSDSGRTFYIGRQTADDQFSFYHESGNLELGGAWLDFAPGLGIWYMNGGSLKVVGGLYFEPGGALGADSSFRFAAGSDAALYVNTAATGTYAQTQAGMLTAIADDRIRDLGGEGFVVTELVAGDHAGYTEVKLVAAAPVPEPAGLGLIGLALLAVRKRRS